MISQGRGHMRFHAARGVLSKFGCALLKLECCAESGQWGRLGGGGMARLPDECRLKYLWAAFGNNTATMSPHTFNIFWFWTHSIVNQWQIRQYVLAARMATPAKLQN